MYNTFSSFKIYKWKGRFNRSVPRLVVSEILSKTKSDHITFYTINMAEVHYILLSTCFYQIFLYLIENEQESHISCASDMRQKCNIRGMSNFLYSPGIIGDKITWIIKIDKTYFHRRRFNHHYMSFFSGKNWKWNYIDFVSQSVKAARRVPLSRTCKLYKYGSWRLTESIFLLVDRMSLCHLTKLLVIYFWKLKGKFLSFLEANLN